MNLRSEKIDILVVNNAIQECLTGWTGASLVEWACAESPLMYEDSDGKHLTCLNMLTVDGYGVIILTFSSHSCRATNRHGYRKT